MLTSAKKQAQDTAKSIARQVAQEPLELLKSARGQLSGEQAKYIEQKINQEKESQTKDPKTQELKNKDTVRSSRALEALDRELQDIRRDKLIKELQRKIAEGQEIPLEDYAELTPEQKQVLKAQMEAVRVQREQQAAVQGQALHEPKSKTPRGSWLFGGKAQAEKQKTHVEKPLPPSG